MPIHSARWPVAVAGVIVLAGVIGFAVWRSRAAPASESEAPAKIARQEPTSPDVGKAALRAPVTPGLPSDPTARPELPAEGSDSGSDRPLSHTEEFASEPRDKAWAPRTEVAIRDRLTGIDAKLETECHQTRCKLVLDGGTDGVAKAIARIESDKGLVGFASSITLTKPEQRPDGTMVLRAFAVFDR